MPSDEPDDTPTTPAARPRRRGWRAVLHWFGMACLLLAAGCAGYVAWLLWGTGLETARAQDRLRTEFTQELEDPAGGNGGGQARIDLGDAYAQILIPAIDVNFMVVQGTSYEDLKLGPGHYPDTANPWDDTGRVGIAGHRTTYLQPFYDLDRLEPGDEITLRTARGDFDYEVTRVFVIPEAGSGRVLDQTEEPTLVLTTCHPRYGSSERLIVEAQRLGR